MRRRSSCQRLRAQRTRLARLASVLKISGRSMKLENCWNLLEHRTLDARRAESPGLIVNARSEIGVLVLWSLCAQCWISGTYAREPSLAAVIPVAPGGVFVRRTSSAAAGAPPSQDMDLAAARLESESILTKCQGSGKRGQRRMERWKSRMMASSSFSRNPCWYSGGVNM